VISAGAASAWLVPALMFLLVIVVSWLGLRWIGSEHLETLASIPLFKELSKSELRSVLRSSRSVEFPPGQTIITEGEKGKGFYVLTRGTATVSVDGKEIVSLGPGAYFGEMAVLDGGPRTATIKAGSPVGTLELTNAALLHVIAKEPAVAHSISTELRRRLNEAGAPVDSPTVGPVDRATLVELSERLRRLEHPDWVKPSSSRGALRLSKLFARGE
jgi:CRP/FNR family transcriptional regulator, cyclic AMP receptor protein